MLTFERQQRILSLLKERSGIKVTELAKLFAVSEGTIRNDLNVLERAGQVTRVRGGAVPRVADRRSLAGRIATRGEPPNLLKLPSGCVLHPRCRYAQQVCRTEETDLRPVGPNHFVRCHRAEELELQGVFD